MCAGIRNAFTHSGLLAKNAHLQSFTHASPLASFSCCWHCADAFLRADRSQFLADWCGLGGVSGHGIGGLHGAGGPGGIVQDVERLTCSTTDLNTKSGNLRECLVRQDWYKSISNRIKGISERNLLHTVRQKDWGVKVREYMLLYMKLSIVLHKE